MAILVVVAAAGLAGGALLGLAPSDEAAPPRTAVPAASRATSAATSTATAPPRAPAWIRRAELRGSVGRIASRSGAEIGVLVRPLGRGAPVGFGDLRTGAAWSTIKVPLVVAHLQRMPRTDDGLVAAALRRSDNAAAQRLFDDMAAAEGGLAGASAAMQDVLRQGGDDRTAVNTRRPAGGFSTYGQTRWSLAMSARFFSALTRGCLRPRAGTTRILEHMGQVVADQRWGLGRAPFRGAGRVRLKGGWGPGADGRYLVRQFGVVETPARRGVVIAIAAIARDGSFEGGIAVLDELAAAVASASRLGAAPTRSAC